MQKKLNIKRYSYQVKKHFHHIKGARGMTVTMKRATRVDRVRRSFLSDRKLSKH